MHFLQLNAYSIGGTTCALLSIHSLYKSIKYYNKQSKLKKTPEFKPSDADDYQVIQSYQPIGYYKLTGKLQSNTYLSSPNGIKCLFYQKPSIFSFYTPFIITQSTELTLHTSNGLQVLLDLTKCDLDLIKIKNELILTPHDQITVIGSIYKQDGQFIMSNAYITNKSITNSSIWKYISFQLVSGCCLAGVSWFCFNEIQTWLHHLIDLEKMHLPSNVQNDWIEWSLNKLRLYF
eukprot:NODE_1533_length_883_cov_0.614796.p1 type:complete len:233 gc:universal NODE_1533_length_883_cov_0.614796:2-700(+)